MLLFISRNMMKKLLHLLCYFCWIYTTLAINTKDITPLNLNLNLKPNINPPIDNANTITPPKTNPHGIHHPKNWLTLNGVEPIVIARGGFSGLFPESSLDAYTYALKNSLPSTVMYCDLQLTRDAIGFCLSTINLQNSTNIQDIFPQEEKTYKVNGIDTKGWFSIDYDSKDLLGGKIVLRQGNLARSPSFDGANIITPLDIFDFKPPPKVWINVEYDLFFFTNKLPIADYIANGMENFRPDYISSPEIGFLKSFLRPPVPGGRPKLIFKLSAIDAVEPTTKKTYGSLIKDLIGIKAFASGILVPKEYIWPSGKGGYLQPATTLVADAHKQGLEVYAYGFANDNTISYNYSYDPTKEYLQFIDNGQFSVDGFLTDFPPTASKSIACLAHNKKSRIQKTLIITNNGASGDYPGSTDLAYQKAIDDGADIIDCSIQMSKDGTAFCSDSADLIATTTAAVSFIERSISVPEIQQSTGIFSFDLTWDEIQTLTPQIAKTVPDNGLVRNPANKNKGKFVTLKDFLVLANSKAVGAILINIDNAAYLASKKGLDIVGSVTGTIKKNKLDKAGTKILIQSEDSSVLSKFKDNPTYKRVLNIDKKVGGVTKEVAEQVKKYADAIRLHRNEIILDYGDVFLTATFTNIIPTMKAANISVYVGILKNEFTNFLFDYYSDPYVELATFVSAGVDGVVTEFPATASAYMRSPCTPNSRNRPYTILPVKAGDLNSYLNQITGAPPAPAPIPPLIDPKDLVDPPLPPVSLPSSDEDDKDESDSEAPESVPESELSAGTNVATLSWTRLAIATVSGYLLLSSL